MRHQNGQAIVEFAFVLPFFLFLLFGIIYFGFLFRDYMILSNVARSSAREAALGIEYDEVKGHYQDVKLTTSVYTWSGEDDSFMIEKIKVGGGDAGSDAVKVTITTTLNENFPAYGLMREVSFPQTYTIQYSMHDESAGS